MPPSLLGRLESVTTPKGNWGATDNTTTFGYDIAGRVTTVTKPAVALNASGSHIPEEQIGFDAFGNVTHTSDAHGREVVSQYDDLNRVIAITHPSYTPGLVGDDPRPLNSGITVDCG